MKYSGTIFKLPFPFTDLTGLKGRPALAISEPDAFGDIEFLFVTTKAPGSSGATIDLKDDAFAGAALATPAWGGSARASKAKKRATAPRIAIVTISSRLAGARLNRRASSPTLKFNVPDQARRESPGARVEKQA